MTPESEVSADAPGFTEDAFLGGRLTVRQPARGYRAGTDAVLLAAAVPAGQGDRVLEAGAGVGVPALCIAERVPGTILTAAEVQGDLCAVGRTNAAANGLAERVTFINADILAPAAQLAEAGLVRETYAHVLANPPFHAADRARPSDNPGKAIAHMHETGDLDRWIRFMVTMAEADASVSIVHRADALAELLTLLDRRVGNLAILPIHSRPGGDANRVLIQGRKGSRAPLRILAGLTMHETDGRFSPQAESILRDGAGLDLA